VEGHRPFDSELDFDQPRASRSPTPAPLAAERRRRGEGGPRRERSETLARIAWALPWIAVAITIVVVGDVLFAGAMVLLACVGMIELFRMAPETRPFIEVACVVAAGLVAAAYLGDQYEIVIAFASVFPLMFLASVGRRDRSGITVSIAFTVFAVAWIAIPFAHAVLLRELPDHGAGLLVDVLVATFVADTAAYAGGRMFGTHRLAPELSPNKTLEGLAFGVAGGTLGFWFAGLYQDWLPGLDALAMGFCIALVAPLGDLFESMLKRDLQIKDSGTIFGPHGGLLDRVDALLFTVVAGYYLAVAFVY
jgi:phosphatidate cytidylyltransferase